MTNRASTLGGAKRAAIRSRRRKVSALDAKAARGPRRPCLEFETNELRLIPGVRDRLQARLTAMGLEPTKIVSHVANLTGRAAQSVRRWFDPRAPGLPDLESFARLCLSLGCSADEVIGTKQKGQADHVNGKHLRIVADSVYAMTAALQQRGCQGLPVRVPGDEMAPQLHEGDLVFIDTGIDHMAGNGIYALECGGKLLIRRIELRLGDGFILKCDNQAYRDWELEGAAATRRSGIRILGKVQGVVGLRLF